MADLALATVIGEMGARLAAAHAEIAHLRGHNAELTRRIRGALHLVDAFDPMAGPGHTAVLQVDLRLTLGGSTSEVTG